MMPARSENIYSPVTFRADWIMAGMGATSAWRAPPGWAKIREQVFARDGRACYRCGRPATTVDHIVAVAVGGGHDLGNLRPACSRCNSSAGASLGNRIGPPRGYRRRGGGGAAGAIPGAPAVTAPAQWRTSREW